MRLSLFPFLPGELVSALERAGIKTDSELMFAASTVDIWRKLPPGTVTLDDLNDYRDQVVTKISATGIRGDVLFDLELGTCEAQVDLTSGLKDLDALLGDGGFGGSRVFEVSGEKASGKTALAMHVVLRHLVRNPSSAALWMDTTGDFLPYQASQLIDLHAGQAQSTAMHRLQISLVFDIESAHDIIDALSSSLSTASPGARIRILVIDSITPLLGPALSFVSSQGHAVMVTFMGQLRALARAYGLAAQVINNATSTAPAARNQNSAFGGTAAKPALGPSFTFLTDATIWIARFIDRKHDTEDAADRGMLHIVEIFRSKSTRSRTWCALQIRDGLLLDA
ncbi:P-loop containing nucleoside triphosphate hydrolase protein [Athelia psychrophila]|uniref:P-loop containing nucleoside triphosphate hydrolase protein n=1 Tax=Athelia psychrophila TaxID=1759441 RepID=A0A166QMR6_9AGAM|nr:P-loop containing nucleoside triphosphate hydrolase protein [Fibularhizoctonia sp. CBS 109695]